MPPQRSSTRPRGHPVKTPPAADLADVEISGRPMLERLPTVLSRTGLSRAGVYRLQRLRKFPRSVKIGTHSVAWLSAEITEWIHQRIAERDALPTT